MKVGMFKERKKNDENPLMELTLELMMVVIGNHLLSPFNNPVRLRVVS